MVSFPTLQGFEPLSQYLCSICGSVLRETNIQVDISTVVEDCPSCGAKLSDTLKRRSALAQEMKLALPKLQTAYDLTRFRIDIEKLSSFMPLSTTGSLCLVGHKANLLLTRLCVRALLPAKHGGLDSPYVLVVDAGNKSDFYQTVNFARQYGLNVRNTLDRIIVSRTFTIHQLKSLLSRELPKVIKRYQPRMIAIPGLLDLFEDPNIKKKEAKKVISRIMESVDNTSSRFLVITSFQESKYADLVVPDFRKRIVLSSAKYNRLNAELYNEGKKTNVTLTEKELKLVPRK